MALLQYAIGFRNGFIKNANRKQCYCSARDMQVVKVFVIYFSNKPLAILESRFFLEEHVYD